MARLHTLRLQRPTVRGLRSCGKLFVLRARNIAGGFHTGLYTFLCEEVKNIWCAGSSMLIQGPACTPTCRCDSVHGTATRKCLKRPMCRRLRSQGTVTECYYHTGGLVTAHWRVICARKALASVQGVSIFILPLAAVMSQQHAHILKRHCYRPL